MRAGSARRSRSVLRWVVGVLGALALAAAGCRDPQLKLLESARDEICACKTVACGTAALARIPQKDARSNVKSQEVARAMLDCLAKLYASDRPVTDPDEPLAVPEAVPEPAPERPPPRPAGSGAAVGAGSAVGTDSR